MQRDPDDWFGEPDVSEAPDRRVTGVPREDDWLELDERGGERAPLLSRRAAQLGLVAGILVILLVAGLAAAGVFSGAAKKPPPVVPTQASPTTTAGPPTTAASPVLLPSGPLKPGDTGTDVKRLQTALARLGDFSGTADGQYGPATQAAVARFQKFANLTADGIAGPQTLKALATALSNP